MNVGKYIIGIDPDVTKQSLAMLVPNSPPLVIYKKVPKAEGCREAEVLQLARATEVIRKILNIVEGWQLKPETFEVYIEHQNMEQQKKEKKVNAQDLTNLAHISGIWSGMVSALLWVPHKQIHIVTASTWKNSQPKRINQPRTLKALGYEYKMMGGKRPYATPTSDMSTVLRYTMDQPNPGDWEDINDSLGLAVYGAKEEAKVRRRKIQR